MRRYFSRRRTPTDRIGARFQLMPSALMADTRYLCNRCVRQNTPQKSEQEKRRTVREAAQPEDSAAGVVDEYAAVREPRLRVKRDVDHADWRQCPIGRTTNRTTFVSPGKPVGDRPAAWPAARKHTGMPPPYGSDMVLPPGAGDDPAPSPKLVPISALQLSHQQDAKDAKGPFVRVEGLPVAARPSDPHQHLPNYTESPSKGIFVAGWIHP